MAMPPAQKYFASLLAGVEPGSDTAPPSFVVPITKSTESDPPAEIAAGAAAAIAETEGEAVAPVAGPAPAARARARKPRQPQASTLVGDVPGGVQLQTAPSNQVGYTSRRTHRRSDMLRHLSVLTIM